LDDSRAELFWMLRDLLFYRVEIKVEIVELPQEGCREKKPMTVPRRMAIWILPSPLRLGRRFRILSERLVGPWMLNVDQHF